MIHVSQKPEPKDFNCLVRAPGHRFLHRYPKPTTKEWGVHSYWRSILGVLHESYNGICAYSCHWIPYDTGADTVEHFRPKNMHPRQAYEWGNYRLVCATLNGRKGTYEDVLDPFTIQNGYFVLHFPSLEIRPGEGIEADLRKQVEATIRRLGLNDEGTCLKSRFRYIKVYCKNEIAFSHLQHEAPFIAMELERQGLRDGIRAIMQFD